MKTLRYIFLSLLLAAPAGASAQAFSSLMDAAGGEGGVLLPAVPPAPSADFLEVEQYLPPDNDEPGFEWPMPNKSIGEDFIYIGKTPTFLKSGPGRAEELAPGTGKCELKSGTLYKASAKPGFEGIHMKVRLAEALPGCSLNGGYVYMSHVASSSAGGFWELPRNVKAFLDTLAYAEGTNEYYNYIFTHVTFQSYADHPRKTMHSGKLYSTAAGRYQFLSTTWDGVAPALGLVDFTPPSQEKAVLEIIRRNGAYKRVLKSNVYENFTGALSKLNGTWASLPGSPYGQPTHSTAALWKYYKAALAKY